VLCELNILHSFASNAETSAVPSTELSTTQSYRARGHRLTASKSTSIMTVKHIKLNVSHYNTSVSSCGYGWFVAIN